MGEHARLGPSGAGRWTRCPGSVAMLDQLPDSTSPEAEAGTAAHELAAVCLEQGTDTDQYLGHIFNDIEVDQEMVCHVQEYVDDVRRRAYGNELLIEIRVDLSECLGVEQQFGTADTIILSYDNGGELIVDDFKYGRVDVAVEDNEQLQLYALGAHQMFSALGGYSQVRMVIHQPRCGGIKETVIPLEELLAREPFYQDSAAKAMQPDAPRIPGEKQCQYCPARTICPEFTAYVAEIVGAEFEDLTGDEPLEPNAPGSITRDQFENVYTHLDTIESWIKALRKAALSLAVEGRLSKHKAVEGRPGKRAWKDKDDAGTALERSRLKLDERYTRKLISPTQAQRLLKDRPKTWAKIEALIFRPPGTTVVVPIDDPRPAITRVASVDEFEPLPEPVNPEGETL